MDNYEVVGVIGKGSFGAVTKVKRRSDGKFFVWKEISYGRMNEREKQQLVAEVNILRELRHPNVVKYIDRIIDREKARIFIVMEFCERGDLAHMIKKLKQEGQSLPEDRIWEIFSQVANALHECHNRERKILHRDIKPGNVFLDSSLEVKLGDFGLSRIMGEDSVYAYTHVGTPFYMSPEQIGEGKYNEKSDIWSLGCLLFEMAALVPPFDAKSHIELNDKIRNGRIGRIPDKYSPELHRIVHWMLSTDPAARPSTEHLLNVPQITMKLRDRKIRDVQTGMKQREADLKAREEEVKRLEEELKKREIALVERENRVAEAEKAINARVQLGEKTMERENIAVSKPLGEMNVKTPQARGRNLSPYDNLPTRVVRDLSGERRTISPRVPADVGRPRTAYTRADAAPAALNPLHYRPRTAVPPRAAGRYNTLHV